MAPLDGLPIGIKDNLCTKNLRTTCCSRMLEPFVPKYNATVVDRTEKAGGIVLGQFHYIHVFTIPDSTFFSQNFLLSCSRHQNNQIYQFRIPNILFTCLINSRARHSAIYKLKSRNLF